MYGSLLFGVGALGVLPGGLAPGRLLLLAALGGAAAVTVLSAWLARGDRSPGGGFVRCLAARNEVAVLLHPNPDPDAMASAMAVRELAASVGTAATLQYPGQIRRHDNRAFRTVLDIDLERIETAEDLAADAVVLVDHNRPRGFTGSGGVEPYAVVDHHPGGGTGRAFTDARPEYGACASILAEYFEELDAVRYGPGEEEIEPPSGPKLPCELATGLLYGIQSDTKRLSKGCTQADLAAYTSLYRTVDETLLDRIANPLVDAEVVDVKSRAIEARDARPPYAVSDVGEVDNLDAIPQAAEELLTVEDIRAVVVIGEKDGVLHLSGRSRDDRLHMGRTLRTAVDDIPMANAGGHARMGGGQVSVEHMNGLGPSKGLSRAEFTERLFAAMGGEESLPRAMGGPDTRSSLV